MPLNFSAKPALTVVTQPYSLEELGVRDFIRLVNGSSSVFINQGQGLIGFGEETRLETTGPNRVEGLNAAWKELVQNSQIQDGLCLPGTGLIAFGAIAFAAESAAKSVLIVPKVVVGLSGAKLWITTINTSFEAAIELIKRAPGDLKTIRFDSGNINPDQFKLNIDHGLMEIAKQNIEKVVLARDLLGEIPSEFDYSLAVQSLANKFDTCFTYSVDGLFGASPELLVKVSHSQVSARVLAGTAGRGTDPGVDEAIGVALTSSHKNLEEHRFAVESLVSELQELANQIDVDEKPFSLPLPNL